ncbi:MAG: aldehyde dehydrogenase family protein [Solirubrobacterales bacterium]|nr:aldehyde dehydrogenase family protein [Solirubrobacterales bacterium]
MHTITPPDSSEELGTIDLTDVAGVAGAIAAARDAQRAWARVPIRERAAALDAAAAALEPEAEAMADLLSAESGKPIAQARFEIGGTIGLLRGNAEEARRLVGRVLPTEGNAGTEDDLAVTRREPLGVVGVILPFNFPAELFVEKCAAALVAGNAVVAKPPLDAPLTIGRIQAALVRGGVPAEILALVQGGADVGAALASGDGIAAVSLTGSTAAGVAVAEAAAPTLRKLHLELGGNNACIVLADADLDLAVAEIVSGRLMMNGQACSATKRVIVAESLHDELAERLAAAAAGQRVGPSREEETTVGPLINPDAAERVAAQVGGAIADGAELIAGSERPDGAYFPPAVLRSVPATTAIARSEEIFGPVFNLIPVADADAAIAVANASEYGLMGSVFSGDLPLAWAIAERLECGGVVINGSDNYRPPVIPFGGVKMSGTGREGLGYTIEELSREKTIVLRRFRDSTAPRLAP